MRLPTSTPGKKRPRGLSLGATLMLALVVFTTVLALASLAVSHLTATQARVSDTKALYLAEGAIVKAIDAVHADATFGLTGQESTFVPDTRHADQYGCVRFQGGASTDLPLSTNNLDGSHPTGAFDTPVPRGYLHLIGVGRVGNTERRVEAMVYRTPFPYALAASGGLTAQTGFDVRGSSDMATFTAHEQLNQPHTTPASMGSIGPVKAQASSFVAGSIRSASTVTLPSGSYIGGGITKGRVDLPRIDITDYKNGCLSGTTHTSDDGIRDTPLGGAHFCGDDLDVDGNVVLDNGVLYVQGSLHVRGGVRGRGSIFVTGDVTVDNGASLDGSAEAALLAGGSVTLQGGTERYFQGLVYSRGSFSASHLTIAGTFVGGAGDPNASVHLGPDVKVVHVTAVSGFSTPGQTSQSAKISDCFSQWSDAWAWEGPIYITSTPTVHSRCPEATTNPAVIGAISVATAQNPAYALVRGPSPSTTKVEMMRSALLSGTWEGQPATFVVNVRSMWYDEVSQELKMDTPKVTVNVFHGNLGETFDSVMPTYAHTTASATSPSATLVTPTLTFNNNSLGLSGTSSTTGSSSTMDAFGALDHLGLPVSGKQIVDAMLDAQYAALQKSNQLTGKGAGSINLVRADLNRFLSDVMPLHVAYWRTR